VKSTGHITDQRLVFGDEKWGDYEVQLEARKLDGAEGFIVLFRVAGEGKFYWANMGGWQNRERQVRAARRRTAGSARGAGGPRLDLLDVGRTNAARHYDTTSRSNQASAD
jgi:hypothetical protein